MLNTHVLNIHVLNIQGCISAVPRFFLNSSRWLLFAFWGLLMVARCNATGTPLESLPSKIPLAQNWRLQSSCEVKATGQEITVAGFRTDGWHKANGPTTVVAALVADGTYSDPYYGLNLKSLPGMDYPPSIFFSNQPMPADSPFRCSW